MFDYVGFRSKIWRFGFDAFCFGEIGWYARLKGGAQNPILFLLMREVNWELGLDPLTVTDIRIIANQPLYFAMLQWSRASVSSKAPDWWSQTVTTELHGLISSCYTLIWTVRGQSEGLLWRDSQFTNRTGTGHCGVTTLPLPATGRTELRLPPGNGGTPLKPKVNTWGGGSSLWNVYFLPGETMENRWDPSTSIWGHNMT